MTGIEYPKITVEGVEYSLRFSMQSEYMLALQGIKIDVDKPVTNPIQRWQIFAAIMAPQMGLADAAKAPTGFAWAGKLTRAEWAPIDAQLDEALKKAAEESQIAKAAVTPVEVAG